jgi:hypothetical protein
MEYESEVEDLVPRSVDKPSLLGHPPITHRTSWTLSDALNGGAASAEELSLR